jgi:hypothetical protein
MTQPIISERIGLTVAPENVQLVPGGQVSIVLAVVNQGPVVDQFGLLVEGLDPAWYTVNTSSVNLVPGAAGTLGVDVHLPDGHDALAGTHEVALRVLSREAPNSPATVFVTLDILALGGVEATLTPQRVAIGWRGKGQYTFAIANRGNADLVLDLVARQAEDTLELRLDPDRLSVPHGGSGEVRLVAVPRKRPIVALARSHSFTVEAAPALDAREAETAAIEPVAMAMGELVYKPLLASLAALPLGLRRLLMALAALALLAALLIWFLAAPGRRGPLIERVPALKPAVAAVETALNMPDKVAAAPDAGAGGAAADPPRIKRFELAMPGQGGRTDYALVWEVEGATEVKIAGTPQPSPSTGTLKLDKLDNAEYILEASNGTTTVNQSVGIVVLRPPEILELTAAPVSVTRGQAATLRWVARRGDRASIQDQPVEPTGGALQVSPTATTTFTLVVENELGRTERSVEVRVTGG